MRWAIFIAFLAFVLFCFACLWDTTLLTHTILWVFGWITVNRLLRTPVWHREIVVREILRSKVEGGETKTFWRHHNTVLGFLQVPWMRLPSSWMPSPALWYQEWSFWESWVSPSSCAHWPFYTERDPTAWYWMV